MQLFVVSLSDCLQSSKHNNKIVIVGPLSILVSIRILWSGNPMATGLLNCNLNTTAISPIVTPHTLWLAAEFPMQRAVEAGNGGNCGFLGLLLLSSALRRSCFLQGQPQSRPHAV